MLSAIREFLSARAEYERSLLCLYVVVDGFTPLERDCIRIAVKRISEWTGVSTNKVLDKCVEAVLLGTPFDDTTVGREVKKMLGGI